MHIIRLWNILCRPNTSSSQSLYVFYRPYNGNCHSQVRIEQVNNSFVIYGKLVIVKFKRFAGYDRQQI